MEPKTVIMETSVCVKICSISKVCAYYSLPSNGKYTQSLETGQDDVYTWTWEGQLIPEPGKVNYTQAKAYCHISLLSFMQNMMQKLVTGNIKDEQLGHVTYIYSNLPTNRNSTETAIHHVITHMSGNPKIMRIFLNCIFLWTFPKFNHPQNTLLENQYTYPTAFSIVQNSSGTLAFSACIFFSLTSTTFWKRFPLTYSVRHLNSVFVPTVRSVSAAAI